MNIEKIISDSNFEIWKLGNDKFLCTKYSLVGPLFIEPIWLYIGLNIYRKNVRYLTLTVRANKIAVFFEPVVRRCCALKNFAKFIGKHLYQSLFFNKVAGLRPVTLSRKKLWHKCFPVNFTKFFKTPFLKEHLRWLPVSLKLLTLQLEILAVISEK